MNAPFLIMLHNKVAVLICKSLADKPFLDQCSSENTFIVEINGTIACYVTKLYSSSLSLELCAVYCLLFMNMWSDEYT